MRANVARYERRHSTLLGRLRPVLGVGLHDPRSGLPGLWWPRPEARPVTYEQQEDHDQA